MPMFRKPCVLYGFLRPVLRKPCVLHGFLKPMLGKPCVLHGFPRFLSSGHLLSRLKVFQKTIFYNAFCMQSLKIHQFFFKFSRFQTTWERLWNRFSKQKSISKATFSGPPFWISFWCGFGKILERDIGGPKSQKARDLGGPKWQKHLVPYSFLNHIPMAKEQCLWPCTSCYGLSNILARYKFEWWTSCWPRVCMITRLVGTRAGKDEVVLHKPNHYLLRYLKGSGRFT